MLLRSSSAQMLDCMKPLPFWSFDTILQNSRKYESDLILNVARLVFVSVVMNGKWAPKSPFPTFFKIYFFKNVRTELDNQEKSHMQKISFKICSGIDNANSASTSDV